MEEQKIYKKPPIGIVPRRIHDDERKIAIFEAMKRYSLSDVVIPTEWIDELMELCMKRF